MTKARIPFFRFYPSDFMNGVRGLSAQEVGVYTMILCRIYEESAPIEYHALRLATYCGMREKTFVQVLEKLIDLGKISLKNGMISNSRAEDEITSRANDLKINSKAGKASAEKRQQNQQKISTGVQRTFNHTDTDTYKNKELHSVVPKAAKRGTRIPEDFQPDVEWSLGSGLTSQQLNLELDKFIDFWKSKSTNATKLDWQATWRNWIRSAVSKIKPTAGSNTVSGAAMTKLKGRQENENSRREFGQPDLLRDDDRARPSLSQFIAGSEEG